MNFLLDMFLFGFDRIRMQVYTYSALPTDLPTDTRTCMLELTESIDNHSNLAPVASLDTVTSYHPAVGMGPLP